MKVGIIGVGQAGGKVTEAILDDASRTDRDVVSAAIAVNSAKADLLGLRTIPMADRLLVGQSRVKGHGAGADNELGATIATEDVDEIRSAISDFPTSEIDAFLVVAGLGGGTGSGGAPVIARELSRLYEEPVYGLGILPSRDEGGIYHLNAARSFITLVSEVDNLLVLDNDAWRSGTGESLKAGYDFINDEIARRIGVMFGAGEATNPSPEMVVDASEIINTLGSGGVSSIGYATTNLNRAHRGLLARFGGGGADRLEESNTVTQTVTTVRQAALGRLSLPCELRGTERALVVVAGPPDALSRRGIERSIEWLESHTGTAEVRGGDYPLPREDRLGALVLLSGVTDVPRIDELRQTAVETQQNVAAIRERSPDALRDLIWSGDDELEPLF